MISSVGNSDWGDWGLFIDLEEGYEKKKNNSHKYKPFLQYKPSLSSIQEINDVNFIENKRFHYKKYVDYIEDDEYVKMEEGLYKYSINYKKNNYIIYPYCLICSCIIYIFIHF